MVGEEMEVEEMEMWPLRPLRPLRPSCNGTEMDICRPL